MNGKGDLLAVARRGKGRKNFSLQEEESGLPLSGRPDLNRGPLRPERSALPGCATPRYPPSHWPGSNRRPLPYQGSALPLSYNGLSRRKGKKISTRPYPAVLRRTGRVNPPEHGEKKPQAWPQLKTHSSGSTRPVSQSEMLTSRHPIIPI